MHCCYFLSWNFITMWKKEEVHILCGSKICIVYFFTSLLVTIANHPLDAVDKYTLISLHSRWLSNPSLIDHRKILKCECSSFPVLMYESTLNEIWNTDGCLTNLKWSNIFRPQNSKSLFNFVKKGHFFISQNNDVIEHILGT